MTNRALRFIAMLDRLEDAVYRKTLAETTKRADEITLAKGEYQKQRSRLREYVKTLMEEDLKSL